MAGPDRTGARPAAASLAEWFEATFDAPLPLETGARLLQTPGRTHWASALRPELAADALMLPVFVDRIGDYAAAGVWGYGTNAYAFYWTERRGSHRCFFRLPYGGAYGDVREDGPEIVRFLEGYARWRRDVEPGLAWSELVWSMGASRCAVEIVAPPAPPIELVRSDAEVPRQANGAPLAADEWWAWVRREVQETCPPAARP